MLSLSPSSLQNASPFNTLLKHHFLQEVIQLYFADQQRPAPQLMCLHVSPGAPFQLPAHALPPAPAAVVALVCLLKMQIPRQYPQSLCIHRWGSGICASGDLDIGDLRT